MRDNELRAAEERVVKQPQDVQVHKRLSPSAGDARRRMNEALDGKQRILTEMRHVRDHTHMKFQAALSTHWREVSSASVALSSHEHRAVYARSEAQCSQTHAAKIEERVGHRATQEKESLAKCRAGHMARVNDTKGYACAHSATRENVLQESSSMQIELRRRHEEQCEAEERHANHITELKAKAAAQAQQSTTLKIRATMERSSEEQQRAVRAIQRSRDAAVSKVAMAKRQLSDKRESCDALLEREKLCNSQARNVALTMKEGQDYDKEVQKSNLERKVRLAAEKAAGRAASFNDELELSIKRNEAWKASTGSAVEAAQSWAECDDQVIAQRLSAAKQRLSEMHLACHAHVETLTRQWEEAKRADALRVEAATKHFEDLKHWSDSTLRSVQEYCAKFMEATARHQEQRRQQLEERNLGVEDLSQQRVAMMKQQARDRLEKAQRQLARLKAHIEDVQERCRDRVQAERVTAQEKIHLAEKKTQGQIQHYQNRLEQAEGSRDAARAAYMEVARRCHGAALEARRRGLVSIANAIDAPPLLKPQPIGFPWDEAIPSGKEAAALSDTAELLGIERDCQEVAKGEGTKDGALNATDSTTLFENASAYSTICSPNLSPEPRA